MLVWTYLILKLAQEASSCCLSFKLFVLFYTPKGRHKAIALPICTECPSVHSHWVLNKPPIVIEKFGVFMHRGIAECRVPFWCPYNLDLCPQFFNKSVQSLSPTFLGRDLKCGMWMHLWMAGCHIPFLSQYGIDIDF